MSDRLDLRSEIEDLLANLAARPDVQPKGAVECEEERPTNRYLFKYMCKMAGIELGVDKIDVALKKVAQAMRLQAPAPADGPRLAAEARVGNTTFGVGVPERLVIEAAQRAASTPTGCLDPASVVEFRRLLADNAERAAFLDSHPAVSEELSNLIAENEQLREQLTAAQAPAVARSQAALDVLAERQRQISAEGWTPEHDDLHADGSLALAAGCYALHHDDPGLKGAPAWWPWHAAWWKPKDRYRNLVKAGALIVAELERLRRAGHPPEQKTGEQP